MDLIPVCNIHATILYRLFLEREEGSFISTKKKPTWYEHLSFVERHPYRFWFIIQVDGKSVGSIYVGKDNSVGVAIFKDFQRKGYGTLALREILNRYHPNPGIPSVRPGYFIANVAPDNLPSAKLFENEGFRIVQHTYGLVP